MRFLAGCLILLILNACTGESAREQDDLTQFSAQWDSTTTFVTDQVTGILKAQEEAQELLLALDTLPKTRETNLDTRLGKRLESLGTASEASFAFVNRWQEGAARLNALKESGTSTLSAADLQQLRQLAQEGQQQAKVWAEQLDSARIVFEEAKIFLD